MLLLDVEHIQDDSCENALICINSVFVVVVVAVALFLSFFLSIHSIVGWDWVCVIFQQDRKYVAFCLQFRQPVIFQTIAWKWPKAKPLHNWHSPHGLWSHKLEPKHWFSSIDGHREVTTFWIHVKHADHILYTRRVCVCVCALIYAAEPYFEMARFAWTGRN